jgi:hypothetical protein
LHCVLALEGEGQNMEDFYDIKSSKIDVKQVNVLAVFDGE